MTTATSSSDRCEAVRSWLADFDQKDAAGRICWHDMPENFEDFLSAARALIEPPATTQMPSQIAETIQSRVYRDWLANEDDPRTPDQMVYEAALAGVHAGIQAAWESWEPENAPGMVDTRETYRLSDLDGTDDEALWLTVGYVLDHSDVEWLRGLEIVK